MPLIEKTILQWNRSAVSPNPIRVTRQQFFKVRKNILATIDAIRYALLTKGQRIVLPLLKSYPQIPFILQHTTAA